MTVIQLIELTSGSPSIYEGHYVVRLDPVPWPRGWLHTTPDIAKAKQFEGAGAARAYWQQQHGVRADGRPNRPLTAWTVEIQDFALRQPA
jgi:hypothetical protein